MPSTPKVIKSESDLYSGPLPPLAVLPAWLVGIAGEPVLFRLVSRDSLS